MKIIQLITSLSGESPGSFDSELLGLGDDGGLYSFTPERKARAYGINDNEISGRLAKGEYVRFLPGSHVGWKLICFSEAKSQDVFHPLDPSTHAKII